MRPPTFRPNPTGHPRVKYVAGLVGTTQQNAYTGAGPYRVRVNLSGEVTEMIAEPDANLGEAKVVDGEIEAVVMGSAYELCVESGSPLAAYLTGVRA